MSKFEIGPEIQRFRENLLDLTNRNPLLNYRASARRTLRIVDELPDQIFSRLVQEGKDPKRFYLEPQKDEDAPSTNSGDLERSSSHELPVRQLALGVIQESANDVQIAPRHLDDKLQTELSPERLETVAKSMARDAITAIEETGVNYLFLSIGMLVWHEHENSEVTHTAPLMLVPVQIDRSFDIRSSRYRYSVTWRGEETQYNLCLVKKLEDEFGIALRPLSIRSHVCEQTVRCGSGDKAESLACPETDRYSAGMDRLP